MKIELYDDGGGDIYYPTKFVVCWRCHGKGSHVNPAIDGNGISTDDECWQDEDFREMYLSGGYDQLCIECGGLRVLEEIDTDRATERQIHLYEQAVDQQQEDAYTRRMESGGYDY